MTICFHITIHITITAGGTGVGGEALFGAGGGRDGRFVGMSAFNRNLNTN